MLWERKVSLEETEQLLDSLADFVGAFAEGLSEKNNQAKKY